MAISKNERIENLQILRFVAAALVLVTHITFYIHERINNAIGFWHGGEIGVPIFFVISGFVMYLSGEKLPRNTEGAKLFLRRRVARVFPLYWLITTLKIAIALIAPAVILHNRPDILSVLGSYALFPMLNDEGQVRPIHGVGWTLLHEMLFYYVFSISLLLRQSPYVFTSLIIVSLWVIGLFVHAESALALVCFNSINLMFVAGMMLASIYKNGFQFPRGLALALLFVGIALIMSPDLGALRRALIGEFSIEAIMIVAALLSIQISALPKLKRLFATLGDSSYSLYLMHPILAPGIVLALYKLEIHSLYVILPLTFVACVGIAHFVYGYIENPLNIKAGKSLERLFPPAALSQDPSKVSS